MDICLTVMVLCTKCKQKICNCTYNFCFLGLVQWFVEIYMQLLLSSNVIQVTLGVLVWTLKPFPFSSVSSLEIPITSRSAVDSAMYSALVVLSAIKYCILLAHIIGQTVYIIMYSFHEWLDNGPSDHQCCHYLSQATST